MAGGATRTSGRRSGGLDRGRGEPVGRRARSPHRHRGLADDQEQVLDLQRLAGNRAVTEALAGSRTAGLVTSVDALELTRAGEPPENGIASIRERPITKGSSILALTQRGIRDDPPIFDAEPPRKADRGEGYVTQARKVSTIPEPIIKEWWPTTGQHKVAEDTYIDVDGDWEHKLEQGEDEHASDAKLAWELTWKLVQERINALAAKPGPAEASPEAATRALWKRYVASLPKDLQPEGETPSASRQRDVLAVRPGTFFAWMWEITVARDTRMYHETRTLPSDKVVKKGVVNRIVGYPQFQVPGPKSDDFLNEIRVKYTPGRIIQGSKLKAGDATGKG